jgi:hypothetical protein
VWCLGGAQDAEGGRGALTLVVVYSKTTKNFFVEISEYPPYIYKLFTLLNPMH